MNCETQRTRVAVIDDHAMVRQALASVLADDELIEVVAQGEDAASAKRILREDVPDVIVLDYNMPGGGALSVLEFMGNTESESRALVLTVHESPHYAARVIEAGAQGFLVKSSAVEGLLDAIAVLRRGEIYITPRFSSVVIELLRRPKRSRSGIESLSSREFELLRLLGSGAALKEAASQLNVSVSTASTYRARVMKKLGIGSTSELIRFAIENELAG